jgi:hypothetical protein
MTMMNVNAWDCARYARAIQALSARCNRRGAGEWPEPFYFSGASVALAGSQAKSRGKSLSELFSQSSWIFWFAIIFLYSA